MSLVEVMMTGQSAVPWTKICAPLETASDPPPLAVAAEAIVVPASIVRLAPGRTKIWVVRL